MKHPLHKLNKKTRNVISGVLVGLASIFAIVNYVNLPKEQILSFVIGTGLFFLAILIFAVVALVIFKGLAKLKKYLMGE